MQVRKKIASAEVGFFHKTVKGVDFVFVDHPCFPKAGGIYSDPAGPYGDNLVRNRVGTGIRAGPQPGQPGEERDRGSGRGPSRGNLVRNGIGDQGGAFR